MVPALKSTQIKIERLRSELAAEKAAQQLARAEAWRQRKKSIDADYWRRVTGTPFYWQDQSWSTQAKDAFAIGLLHATKMGRGPSTYGC